MFLRSIFTFLVILSIISTFYDIKTPNSQEDQKKIFVAFSLFTNFKKIFDVTPSAGSLNCIHGIRSISALCIILCHRVGMPSQNISKSQRNFLISTVLAVETFFVLGGFLQTISVLKLIEKNKLNIPRVLWRRYLRYTPAVLGASFLYVLHPHVLGENVFNENAVDMFRDACRELFWNYLSQTQNYCRKRFLFW